MANIEKLQVPNKVNFNKVEIDRHIRTLFTKINEIIDVLNEEDVDIDDEDDDED